MTVRIVSKTQPNAPGGVSQYWTRLVQALKAAGVAVAWHGLGEWASGKAGANPASDLLIVDNHDALHIQPEYAVIAVQHGCAMEHGLRCGSKPLIEMGIAQAKAATRKRVFWVACSDWAAERCRVHMGVRADRIIFGGVDVDSFVPSERQRLRTTETPVVLHHCVDGNKGQALLGEITQQLGAKFVIRQLKAAPEDVPNAMRGGDIWLCLSASEGLPTVVEEAMATNLVVVGTNVGVLWPHTRGTPLHRAGMVGWLNGEIGGVVFDWQQRRYPEVVASHIGAAWQHRAKFNGRKYARQWFSLETFGRKWLETIEVASQRFGLEK